MIWFYHKNTFINLEGFERAELLPQSKEIWVIYENGRKEVLECKTQSELVNCYNRLRAVVIENR